MSVRKERRIAAILHLMKNNEWDSSLVREYSERFRASEKTIARDAQEAKRILFCGMGDEELASLCTTYLDSIVTAACADRQFNAAVSAVKVMLEARGLLTKNHRVETVTPMSPRELVDAIMDDPQLRPMVARALLGESSVRKEEDIVTQGSTVEEPKALAGMPGPSDR